MDSKSIFAIAVLAVIIIAILFNKDVKAKIMGLNLNVKNKMRRNKATIKGNNNESIQSSSKGVAPVNNVLNIDGDNNKSSQS